MIFHLVVSAAFAGATGCEGLERRPLLACLANKQPMASTQVEAMCGPIEKVRVRWKCRVQAYAERGLTVEMPTPRAKGSAGAPRAKARPSPTSPSAAAHSVVLEDAYLGATLNPNSLSGHECQSLDAGVRHCVVGFDGNDAKAVMFNEDHTVLGLVWRTNHVQGRYDAFELSRIATDQMMDRIIEMRSHGYSLGNVGTDGAVYLKGPLAASCRASSNPGRSEGGDFMKGFLGLGCEVANEPGLLPGAVRAGLNAGCKQSNKLINEEAEAYTATICALAR